VPPAQSSLQTPTTTGSRATFANSQATSANGSRGSTPTFNTDSLNITDPFLDEGDDEAIVLEEETPIPDWFNLDLESIYDKLNPRTKEGVAQARAWRKRATDGTGKPMTSIGIVANRLLKILTVKKFMPDTTLNTKLQTKKAERQQQKEEFTRLGGNLPAVTIIQKFLTENILLPVNADGSVIDVESITVNVGARVIMLAVDPESYSALNDIFASPDKEVRRAQIDDKSLSFNEKWNSLANCFMNAQDFAPENEWGKLDSRIQDVDPRSPPLTPWTGEQLRKHFRSLKTKFALVDDIFCRSGNLEAGADVDEADRFDGHIRRLLPNESADVHVLLLFAFWAFDKKPPKFISRAKPEAEQFDTSVAAPAANAENSSSVKQRKKLRVEHNTDALARAVSSLAPSQEEQEQRVQLLAQQKLRETTQEKRDYQSWRRSECERFLSVDVQLPPQTKAKLQDKMTQLAEDFLKDNF